MHSEDTLETVGREHAWPGLFAKLARELLRRHRGPPSKG